MNQRRTLRVDNNDAPPRGGISFVQVAKRCLGNPFALANLVLDAAAHIVRELIRIGLGHNGSHVPHHLLHAVGVLIDHIAFAHKVDFKDVLFHQAV
ncbi:MAG: hypothetical protein PHW63_01815 [Alphaproteobacteria bacterium]|nr:hypothetical protein [Alphaproteobacteria bacterium]